MQPCTALPARSSDTLRTFPIPTGTCAPEFTLPYLRFGIVIIAFFLVARLLRPYRPRQLTSARFGD